VVRASLHDTMSMTSEVFLRRVTEGAAPADWAAAARAVLEAAGISFISRGDLVAVKLHVGEPGLHTYLPPGVAEAIVGAITDRGGRPFLTDTSVLYTGPRSNGAEHAAVAQRHGFTVEQTGAAFVPADGLDGRHEVKVPIRGKHFREVGVAHAIADADGMVVLSHATGHLATGFGATLKNVGMGCASRKGKLLQHSDTKPKIRRTKCTSCGSCVASCPEDAIALDRDGVAVIDYDRCIGCGECIASCRVDAVGFNWDSASSALQEKMVEHVAGVVAALHGHITYVVGIVNLTRECDCMSSGSDLVARDIGFAASTDPVALDQAVQDLVRANEGAALDALSFPKLSGDVQLAHAEWMGLGTRAYQLRELA